MRPGRSRRRLLARVVAGAAALGLGACAPLLAPRRIEISEQRLQEALAQRFPLARQLGEAGAALRLDGPRLALLPDANRVGLACDAAVGQGLLRRPVAGTLALSFGLAFDASANVLRAVDVRIDALRLEGLEPALARVVERVARPLAESLLQGQPVYALRPRDVERLASAGLVPGAIRVTGSGIAVELVPARAGRRRRGGV